MILKTLFLLGDIGFFNPKLDMLVNNINNKLGHNDAVAILGDNFYPSGVENNNDPQWIKFIETFKNTNKPIYSILGNHDYLQNPVSQIKNSKWIMDSWYYKKEYDNIDLYFLDTIQFNIHTWVSKEKIEEVHGLDCKILIENQLEWLNNELCKKPNKKKLVLGHYPIITNGVYKDKVVDFNNYIIDTFKRHNVNIYLSGHEHNIQYLNRKYNDFDFNQIIVGSSSENRIDDAKHKLIFECSDDMFDNKEIFYGKLHIFGDYVIMRYYNEKNELKHQFKIIY